MGRPHFRPNAQMLLHSNQLPDQTTWHFASVVHMICFQCNMCMHSAKDHQAVFPGHPPRFEHDLRNELQS